MNNEWVAPGGAIMAHCQAFEWQIRQRMLSLIAHHSLLIADYSSLITHH